MEVKVKLIQSIENRSLLEFLLGSDYFIESSQYSPEAGQIDISKIISKGIYSLYFEDKSIKKLFEQSLCEMSALSDYGLYMCLKYFASQLFKQKNHLSPFEIDANPIIEAIKNNLAVKENAIKSNGIEVNVIGYIDAWPEIERLRHVIKDEYGIEL